MHADAAGSPYVRAYLRYRRRNLTVLAFTMAVVFAALAALAWMLMLSDLDETAPPPGAFEWGVLSAFVVLTVLALGWALVRSAKTRSIAQFQSGNQQPDIEVALDGFSPAVRDNQHVHIFHGTLTRTSIPAKLGARVELVALGPATPPADNFPPRLSGFMVKPGAETGLVMLDTPTIGAVWPAELSYAFELKRGVS